MLNPIEKFKRSILHLNKSLHHWFAIISWKGLEIKIKLSLSFETNFVLQETLNFMNDPLPCPWSPNFMNKWHMWCMKFMKYVYTHAHDYRHLRYTLLESKKILLAWNHLSSHINFNMVARSMTVLLVLVDWVDGMITRTGRYAVGCFTADEPWYYVNLMSLLWYSSM